MDYSLSEKAIIFLDGFINLEYKHKRNIISLYENIEELFENFDLCLNYIKQNLGESEEKLFIQAKQRCEVKR